MLLPLQSDNLLDKIGGSMFAVVDIGGKQYAVRTGDTITVEHLEGKPGEVVTLGKVLLTHSDGKTQIGEPLVKNSAVKAKIVSQQKGKKITVRRFKSKVRYRRTKGFRALETTVQVTSIGQP